MTNTNITLATSAASIAPLNLPNDNTDDVRKKLMSDVRKFASEAGSGARGLVKTAAVVVQAAAKGAISLTPRVTNGKKTDDADTIYKAYADAYSAKSAHTSHTQQASKLRAFVKLGAYEHVDGVSVFIRANKLWEESKEGKAKVLSEYKAMLAVAYAQNKLNEAAASTGKKAKPLTDAEILDAISPGEKERKEVDLIKSAIKRLKEAYEVRERAETASAIAGLEGLLSFVERDHARAEKLAQLAALQAELGIAA